MPEPIKYVITWGKAAKATKANYTSEPKTIWALPEGQRCDAVKDIFRQASEKYLEAVKSDDAKSAQQWSVTAINAISGLFPDTKDPAHRLIISLIAASVAARSGSNDHILLRPGARVPGTKSGLNIAIMAAAGVAAVWFLENKGMSKNAARKAVASILSKNGLSRRRGEYGEPKPLTASAIRAWEEKPDHYPLVLTIAPGYHETLEREASARGLLSTEEALTFLREQAAVHLPTMFAF
ncbi:hypothetical protein I5E68_09615 [Novosphingobium sp. YJ-S2-02]|uniref:Uncharacterized protein n=1 Tax=Novosphingobium aureum TaxID=2792964 RepID=A0A931HBX9_9SPHN|nr:hypothetical protein [Novosphingobium aureum]MBH0113202.1 hypothetical protein [Novosphingobium aureum]